MLPPHFMHKLKNDAFHAALCATAPNCPIPYIDCIFLGPAFHCNCNYKLCGGSIGH
jgi:hypothetical protein